MSKSEDTHLFQNMRSMISLIDKLRDFNLDDYIALPRIAVLGEQSAGKSSLLESIAGLTFLPRGTGIVTRRPLEIRMIRKNVDTPYFVFPKDYGDKEITNPKEATRIIEELTDKGAGDNKNISDIPIICRIYSSTVPDLTLVDLPGITRNPVEDQPDNIEEITKNLVSLYCKNEDTIILCVIPANIDLSNSDALNFARKLDPRGERTLGVLTKIDLMDEGTDATKTLMNEEIKLLHGYVGVKGRSQADIKRNIHMKEAIQKEIDYFGKHPIYSSLPTHLVGTLSLIDRISKLLHVMIQKSLPKIQKEIISRKQNVMTNLQNYGEEFPEEEEKKLEIVFRMVRKFKECFDQEVNGRYFHQILINKKDTLFQRNTETITYKLNNLFKELYEDFTKKNFKVADEYTDDQIKNAIDVYQGDSIPGFQSFDSFLFLIHPQLEKLKNPIYHLIDEAKSILEERGLQILEKIFKNFGILQTVVRDTFIKLLNDKKKHTRDILHNIIKCEDNYLFSNDPLLLQTDVQANKNKNMGINEMLVMELRNRINKYFFIVVRNLRDSVPKLIGQFLLKKFNNTLEVEILNDLNSKNYCLESMYENKKLKNERDVLKKELAALSKAESLLVSDFGMGFTVINNSTPNNNSHSKTSKKIDIDNNYQENVLDDDLLNKFDQINEDFLKYNEDVLIAQNQHFSIQKTAHSLPNKPHIQSQRSMPQNVKSVKNETTHQKTNKTNIFPDKIMEPENRKQENAPERRQAKPAELERTSITNILDSTTNNQRPSQTGFSNLKSNVSPNNIRRPIKNHHNPFNKLDSSRPQQNKSPMTQTGTKGNVFNKGGNNLFGNNLFGGNDNTESPKNNNSSRNLPSNNNTDQQKKKKYEGFLEFF